MPAQMEFPGFYLWYSMEGRFREEESPAAGPGVVGCRPLIFLYRHFVDELVSSKTYLRADMDMIFGYLLRENTTEYELQLTIRAFSQGSSPNDSNNKDKISIPFSQLVSCIRDVPTSVLMLLKRAADETLYTPKRLRELLSEQKEYMQEKKEKEPLQIRVCCLAFSCGFVYPSSSTVLRLHLYCLFAV